MPMDAVSLPVVSATAPPPPRAAAPATAGQCAASSGRTSRPEGGRPEGPHGPGEPRNFDDVLTDVHAAKDEKASTRSATAKDEDEKRGAKLAAEGDATQTQGVVAVVPAVPVAVMDSTPKIGAETGRHVKAADEHDDHNRAASDARALDGVAAVQASAGCAPIAAAPLAVAVPLQQP